MTRLALAASLALVLVTAVSSPALADPPLAPERSVTCKPAQAAIYPGSRVHVMCDKPWKNPSTGAKASYFAVAASDPAAAMVLEVADTAIGHGKKVLIWFRTDSSDNPPGCGTADCRKLTGITVLD
ncbi:MAG TPA: hypothetical protein VHE35_29245 [Kofleriaceae bacterium]|nr:hypothetical protein [Kofleriaceae bacterium]